MLTLFAMGVLYIMATLPRKIMGRKEEGGWFANEGKKGWSQDREERFGLLGRKLTLWLSWIVALVMIQ